MLEENYFLELIDIPILNFDRCLGGKLGFVRRNVNVGDQNSDFKAWSLIYDQYLSKYGIGTKYSIYLDKIEELTVLNCDIVLTGDRFLLNRKRILEAEIKEMSKGDKSSLADQMVAVSKWMGSRVNPRETSADEFYSMVEMIKKENQKNGGKKNREY